MKPKVNEHDLDRMLKLTELQQELLGHMKHDQQPKNQSGIDAIWTLEENIVRLQSIMINMQRMALQPTARGIEAATVYTGLSDMHFGLTKERNKRLRDA